MSLQHVPGQLVKAVFQRVLFQDLSADLIGELAKAGLDLSTPLKSAYPKDVWCRSIELTAESLFSEAAPDARLRRLGRHLIESLESRKLVNGPWLSMAKFMGPRRALKQGAELGAQHSPIPIHVKERSAKELEVSLEEDAQPEFLAGMLEGLVEALGGRSAQVTVESVLHGKAVMAASWR